MVADHRRFINKLNHVCGRVAPAEGKRPHRAQNGAKIILGLWSNFERLNPVIDIGARNVCNNAISHCASKSRQPRLKIADVNLAFALHATVRDELICHLVDTSAASSFARFRLHAHRSRRRYEPNRVPAFCERARSNAPRRIKCKALI